MPPQLGQRSPRAPAQAEQNVQSYGQTRAFASFCNPCPQRSQALFIQVPLLSGPAVSRPTCVGRSNPMKAVVVEHRGETGSLKEIPVPKPAAHEILTRITAAGVNPIDWKLRDHNGRPFPFVLGQDFAGLVSATGDRVTKYRRGERLFGIARQHGSYAEYTVVPEDDHAQPIAKIPDSVGDAEAAALPTAGLTALAAIDALQVEKGTTLLVLGATGGVGGFAVQIAHDRGARIIGSARAGNESLARSLGVDEFLAYDRQNVVEAVKLSHPNGIDAVLDLVDDAEAIKAMAAIVRADGRIVSTIHSADVDWFAGSKIAAQNLVLTETPQSSHAGLRTLLELVEQGRVRVMIAGERALSDAVEALDESRSGTVDGKLVITVE
jgi:NADPH:quinone reductase-like Zn-dependent oxidoreductase